VAYLAVLTPTAMIASGAIAVVGAVFFLFGGTDANYIYSRCRPVFIEYDTVCL